MEQKNKEEKTILNKLNKENFVNQMELVETIFYDYMTDKGYLVNINKGEEVKYLGYGGYATKDDKFAIFFKLCEQNYPRTFAVFAVDRNGYFAIDGETVAIYNLSISDDMTNYDIEEKFKELLKDIYEKYSIYSKENRLDFVYNEYEIERKNYDKLIENKIDLYELIDNFCESCTDKEWDELLKQYCISDNENYMGEVRKNIEEAIITDYNSSSEEDKRKIINQLNRYVNQEKTEEESEFEMGEINGTIL